MKLGRLNHVGVATPSIEQRLELYRTMFGAEPHGSAFDLPAQGVRVTRASFAAVPAGSS
jgi:methylmalonyl-CoA/ethylmalonyl-CoA epimerase